MYYLLTFSKVDDISRKYKHRRKDLSPQQYSFANEPYCNCIIRPFDRARNGSRLAIRANNLLAYGNIPAFIYHVSARFSE